MTNDLKTAYKNSILAAKNLPTLPTTLLEVNSLLENPNVSLAVVAEAINRDQVLAAKILKMINSPIYGFPGRIASVQHALVLLGYNVIRGVIISTSILEDLDRAMRGLWKHSLACSVACTQIARFLDLKDPEEYLAAGLLHDLGKVIVSIQLPAAAKEAQWIAAREEISYSEAESRVLGFTHERVNAWVADQWHLPLPLRESMVHHHRPMSAQHYPEMACVTHLGNFFARLYEVGFGGDDLVPQVSPQAFKLLGLNRRVLESLLDLVGEKLEELNME